MAFDPFKDGGATELKDDFDPFKDGSATEEQNYLADKARRLGRAIPKAIGDTVASAGSAVQSAAELAAEALRWRAVRSGDMTEAEAAAAKARLLDAASQTAPMQAAQAIRDVGQELTDVGPRHFAAPDPARNEEVGSAVTSGAASLVPLLAAGMAAPVAAIPAAAGYMGETQRQDAVEKGATPTQQAAAFALGAPVGAASEALLGVPALLASVRGAKAVPGALGSAAGGLDTMLAATVGKIAPAILPVAQQAVKSAVREGVQEGLEQIAQNTLAKDVVAYDPTRDRTEGAGMAMLAGSIVGGGVGAAAQAGQELDTRRNLAESKATLLAQQQQLVRGLRPAQMFPVDADGKVTNELPLPPEMQRVETDRGVFHFNPALIDEATLVKLSGAGRENQPLGLGSQSKADVAARVAKGDPAVAVTERQPDGTEVKTAVATRGTAAQTTAELKASQTPGNTVQTEPLGQTIQERSGNFVADLLARDATAAAAQRAATAKEEAERAARQKDLDEKKARFDERLAIARATLADPAAPFPAVDGSLKTITSYAEDNAIGLTQTQREQAAQTQAALAKRHAQLAPAATAAADAEAATRRAEAQLAADAKAEKIRRERAALQHLETTGRDLATGKIADLTAVPDDELAALDPAAEGLAPTAIEAEIERRGQAAERAAATQNEAGYSLRDLILGKKAALAAAGRTQPLRLKTPAALALEGGTMAGEHRAIGERTGGFRIFADTGLAEDTLQEQLQQLGFTAPDVPTAYALYERAINGEDIRPERGEENQVEFAETPAPTAPANARPAPAPLTDPQVDQQLAALRREFPALTRDLDLRSGLVADELRTASYRGPVPAGVQAAILQLRGEKRLLVIAAQAARSNQGAGLFLHEMAHPFFDNLPTETKTILRELHAQEMRTKTGPLFDAAGQLTTDVFVRADQFSPARLAADPDLPIKEWFAERVRALNADWLAGRIPRDHSTLVRVWRELLAKLRAIFARVRGLDTDSDLFTETFRRWLDTGARADLTRTGLAYAQRKRAEFAETRGSQKENPVSVSPPDLLKQTSGLDSSSTSVLNQLFQSAPRSENRGDGSQLAEMRSAALAQTSARLKNLETQINELLSAIRTITEKDRLRRNQWQDQHGSFASIQEMRQWFNDPKMELAHVIIKEAGKNERLVGRNVEMSRGVVTYMEPLQEFLARTKTLGPISGFAFGSPFTDGYGTARFSSTGALKHVLDGETHLASADGFTYTPFPKSDEIETAHAKLADLQAEKFVLAEEEDGRTSRLEAKQSAAEWARKTRASEFAALLDARDEAVAKHAQTFTARVWEAFGKNDEVFQNSRTDSPDAAEIAKAVSGPGRAVTVYDGRKAGRDYLIFTGREGTIEIHDADTARPYIRSTNAKSQGKQSGGGSQLYMAALDWIHNNGKRIKDDAGLTSINAIRRTSNFLASAIRWGTTKHLKPHADQGMKWTKSDALNVSALAAKEMANAFNAVAEARSWRYDFTSGEFRDSQNQRLTRERFETAVRVGNPAQSGVGLSTLQRAVITHSAIEAFARGETETNVLGAAERGVVPAGVLYAQGPEADPKTRLAEIEQRLADLSNSQEDAADIEARGRALTAERDQLRRDIAAEERTAATASTIRVPAQMQPAARKLTGVDFAATAADYVTRNGTPAAKVDAARADIERLLGIVAEDQLDLFAYGTRGPDSARSAPLPRSDVERSGTVSRNADEAAALKNPTDSRALRTAYGIGERDAYGTTGTTRISSIIPELIADPKRTWDIRGATITTARDLVALVNVLRTPYVETTKIVFLNQSGEVVHSEIMSIGAIAAANLNPQMMARTLSRAPATVNGYDIIISHNHPSGNPTPSPADVKITRQIREVLRATPHRFRDHVVTNGDTYFSFAESGELGFETGAITTKKPTAAGPDAQNRAELGTLAPWEKVARGELRPINNPYAVNEIVAALRQVDPTALHIIYLNHKTNLTALERVPEFTLEQGEDTNAIIGQIFAGLGREGANQFIVAAPDVMPAHAAARLMRDLRGWANTADIVFLDFASKTLTPESTARSVGLMEGPAPQFATGPDPTPKARLAEIEQRLADLSNSQEDAAEIEARGRALTAERDQLRREIASEERTATTAAALAPLATRHPLAVATPEPGDAWAMAPKMTDGELAAERERVTTHVHDHFAGLAPAERAALGARVQALTAEQIRRGLPTGATVTPIPKVDRRAALLAELARGRALRDEGDRTGNHAANAEGVRLVRLATDTLDAEFPGWDAKPPATQASTPPPIEPPPAEAAPANEGDGEESPFSGAEEDTMPVRRGKWNEVYGHSAYQPSFLARSWRKLRAVLTGIKGPIPELPTFPAAWWNRADTFIREQGAQFYARVSEGERALKSANDYIQRTAEEQLGQIITPLLNQGEKFNAEDYARLQSSQEKARRAQADGRPVPPGLAAEITALNSKMETSPYVLFNRLVFALDLHWRAQNLKDDRGSAITLPAGINAAETKAEVDRLAQTIAAGPHAALIKRALDQHMALVQQVAADLKSRELLAADHLANPYYFPHLTLEKRGEGGKIEQRELTPARVRPGTEADFRGYLETPVGSTKAIEQDYVRAMYYHLVQVGAHNFKADAVRDYFRPYDIKATVEARAKELTKQRGRPVSWEMAFNEEFAPRGYVKYGTDSRDAFPTLTVNRDALARRLGVMLSSEDIHRQLAALDQKGIRLLPEDIRETLSQGERETWIVPARVAEALRGIGDRLSQQDNALEAAAKFTLGIWKGWKLFMPWNHVRYEYGNVVADIEKILSSSPGTFKQLPNAAKELRAFWTGGEPSADLRAALKEGVITAITAQEMDTLTRLKAFEAFQTRSQKAWDIFKRRGSSIVYQPVTSALGLGDFSSPELSALREAITRYAKFKNDLTAIRAGARPDYAGAYWKNIEAMTDSRPGAGDAAVRKAAAISKATFGDYGDLSVLGQTARDRFVPFYSWMEINFRYHANLLRNLRDMVQAGEMPAPAAAGKAAKTLTITAAGLGARTAGAIALRLALPYMAVFLWNNSGDRDELEKLLSEEDRRRFHVILGRDPEGKVLVAYGNTALMDVLKWFSGPKFAAAMGQWYAGKTDFATAVGTWKNELGPDLLNNTAGSVGPGFKIPYALAAKKATFPDITDQRSIPAYDMRRHILGQVTDEFTADAIERTVNKDYYGSKDLTGWAKQLILQVRQRDPESWAFYAIKDKANDYLEKRTGTKRDNAFDAPDQQVLRNFRRAIYRGDADMAVQFYQRLLDYGYTAERFEASIRSQDPLAALPKQNGLRQEFEKSLSPDDRALLDRAYVFYQRMSQNRGRATQLFPRQASGLNGQMRYQAQPRTEALRAMMERTEAMTDEELRQRAQRDERRSLQRTP